jgi:hypothetical protein
VRSRKGLEINKYNSMKDEELQDRDQLSKKEKTGLQAVGSKVVLCRRRAPATVSNLRLNEATIQNQ